MKPTTYELRDINTGETCVVFQARGLEERDRTRRQLDPYHRRQLFYVSSITGRTFLLVGG